MKIEVLITIIIVSCIAAAFIVYFILWAVLNSKNKKTQKIESPQEFKTGDETADFTQNDSVAIEDEITATVPPVDISDAPAFFHEPEEKAGKPEEVKAAEPLVHTFNIDAVKGSLMFNETSVAETAETEPAKEESVENLVSDENPAQESAAQEDSTDTYSNSFTAKLILASPDIKEYYSKIKNALLSFKEVKSRVGWSKETFKLKNQKIAVLSSGGKSLSLYLALDPQKLSETKYKVQDMSEKKIFAETPALYKISSGKKLQYAFELIDLLKLEQGETVNFDYAAGLNFTSVEDLLERKLIKKNK